MRERRTAVLVAALVGCLAGAAGCGSGSPVDDTGFGGFGPGGSGGGGAGGSQADSCPSGLPAPSAQCIGAATCFYEDCAGSGRNVARCVNGGWAIETGPCTGVFCQSQTCEPGQLCLMRAGGALLVECIANTCGTVAIGCGCLQSCAGTCVVNGSVAGVTINCNTCQSNLCP